MLKKIIKIVRRVILSFIIIYGYNLLISPINLIIPINLVTLTYTTILGIPAFLSIIVVSLLIY
ncbi:MAG TPA: pro-sigmaK processing inhibitor BofA family protein [Bacilli bacterium]|nr:pro-sigmaK processing inhibitor BofA family protein [Bacilli bacterium]